MVPVIFLHFFLKDVVDGDVHIWCHLQECILGSLTMI